MDSKFSVLIRALKINAPVCESGVRYATACVFITLMRAAEFVAAKPLDR